MRALILWLVLSALASCAVGQSKRDPDRRSASPHVVVSLGDARPSMHDQTGRLLYTQKEGGADRLHVLDTGTGESTPVDTKGTNTREATWSADGNSIFYVVDDFERYRLFQYRMDGSSHELLLESGETIGGIVPSAAGDKIALCMKDALLDPEQPFATFTLCVFDPVTKETWRQERRPMIYRATIWRFWTPRSIRSRPAIATACA